MKQLWLVRHAKSDMGPPSLPDIERVLNASGLETAAAMGGFLAGQGANPEVLIASPALRARQTAELLCRGLSYPVGNIQFEKAVYEALPETLLDVIQKVSMDVERLMLVGHNPGIASLVHMLGGSLVGMSTCTVVSMGFDSPDWDLLCYPPKYCKVWNPGEVLG